MINTGGKRMQKNKNVTSEVIITSVHHKYLYAKYLHNKPVHKEVIIETAFT